MGVKASGKFDGTLSLPRAAGSREGENPLPSWSLKQNSAAAAIKVDDVYASAVTGEAAGDVDVRVVNIAESPKLVTLLISCSHFSGLGPPIAAEANGLCS